MEVVVEVGVGVGVESWGTLPHGQPGCFAGGDLCDAVRV